MPADLNYLLQARRNRYAQPAGGARASSPEDPRAAVEEEAFQAESKRLALAAKEQEAAAEEAAKAYEKGRRDADKEALRARNNEMEAKARREKRPIYTDADGVIQSQYTDDEWQAQKQRKAKNDQLRTRYFKEQRPWVEDADGNLVTRHTDEQWQAMQAEKVAKEKAKVIDDQAKDWREQKGAALTAVDDQTAQVMRGLDLDGQDLGLRHKAKLDTVKKANAQIKLLEQEIENGETEAGQILDGAAIAKRTAARQALVGERDKVQAEADEAEAKLRAHEVRKLEYSRANNEVQGWLQREKHGLKTALPPVVMGVKGREEPAKAGTTLPGGRNQSQSPLQTGAPSPETGGRNTLKREQRTPEEAVRRAVMEGRISALAEDDSLSDEERAVKLTRLMLQRDDPAAYETQVLQEFESLDPEQLNATLDGHLQDFEMRKQDWQSRRDALREQTQAVNAEVDGVLARNAQRLQQPHKAADLIEYTTADGGKVSVFKDLAPQLEQAQEKAGTFEKQNQAQMDQINAEGGELERAAKLIHAGGGVFQKKQEGARVAAKAERQKVYEQLNAIPGAKLGDELAAVDAAVEKHQGGDDVSLQEWAAKEREKIAAKAEDVQKKVGPAVQEAYAAASAKMPAGVDLNGELDRDPLGLEGPASEAGVTKLLEKMGLPSSKENRQMAVKMLRDAAVLDWSRGDTSAPVRTDSAGRVLVNPERWTDGEAYAEAVAGAGASEAEKAKALKMQPELKAQAIKLKLDTLRPLGVFREWEEAEVPPTREEKMQARANGTQAVPRKLHEGLSDEEKLKLFEKENSGVFSTGAWKVRWNQALLGAVQGVIGLAQSATGIAAPFSDTALDLNRRFGQDAAQLGAASQALPTGQWVNQGASMLVSSAPSLAVGGAVGAATRSEMLALQGAAAGAGLQTFGQVYGDAVQGSMQNKGMTKDEARQAALVPALASGVSTYALTAAGGTNGMESALRQEGFKQGLKQWLTTVGKGALKEGVLEEGPDQLIQGVIARHSYDPTKSWASIWEETATAVIGGALMGGAFEMMSGGGGTSQNGKGMEEQGNGGTGQAVGPEPVVTPVAETEPVVARPEPAEAGTTLLPETGPDTLKREQRTKEAEAELAGFAPEGMSAAAVAATKAKAEVLLRMAQGETLADFNDEELRQVGLNRDGTPGHYESVPVDKKNPQAGRTSVWKKGVRADGFQPVVVEDGELIITQRQIDNLGVRLPAVAARIGKSEVERRREIAGKGALISGKGMKDQGNAGTGVEGRKEAQEPEKKGSEAGGGQDGQDSRISGLRTELAAAAAAESSPVVASPEPAQAGTTLLPEDGTGADRSVRAPVEAVGFDPAVERRVDEIGAELAGRGLSGEQALRAARGVVGRMGVMGPKYEVQMIDPAFEEAMKAEGFQRDPAKMSRWMARGQFKAETRGEKPVMRKAEGAKSGPGVASPEPAEAGTTIPGGQSQLQTGAPSTEAGKSARAPLIERGDWKQAKGEVIGVMQGRAKGLPEAGKKAAGDKIKAVVKRFNKLEELIDTKFGRLFEGVRIVPNGSSGGGGLAAQVTGYDAQGRATGVELVVDAATFAEAGGVTDSELERALNEEWQHRADLMVMSRSEAIALARDIHAAQPGVFNSAWKQYFAVYINAGSKPAKPPVELTDDEAYMMYFEASRMIRQGTFTSENAAIRDVGLLQRMYLMLSRYVNFVKREMKKLPQDLRELWEDKLTAAEAVMRKTKEAGIRLQKEGLDDVEPPEGLPQKGAKTRKKEEVNEDEEAMAMAADAEMDVRPERKGALRNPGENAIRGMAAIPDPDNGKENVVVWINRYHGRITRPSKGWLERMAQDGKDRSKIGDWDDIRQAEIPSFYAGLVFKNGNGSTLDQALQELHGLGYFPGVAAEDVTGEMLARKIKDVIQRYQGKKQGGATTVQDEEQAHFERMEKQRVEFERSTSKGPIYVKPHEMQPGDVMMVKADDGKMHRVEVLRLDSEPVAAGDEFDPDANPAQFMGPDGPMEIRSVTLRDGTTFGVQTIDGQQGLYVDAFSVRQEGDFYAGLSDAVQNRTIDDADAVLRVMQHEGMDATTPFSQIVLAIQQNLRVPMRRAQKMLAQVMDTDANATVWTNEELKEALESPLGSPKKQAGPGLFGEDEMNFLGDRNTLGLFEQAGRKEAQVSGKGMKEQGNAGTGVGTTDGTTRTDQKTKAGGGQDLQNSIITGLPKSAERPSFAQVRDAIVAQTPEKRGLSVDDYIDDNLERTYPAPGTRFKVNGKTYHWTITPGTKLRGSSMAFSNPWMSVFEGERNFLVKIPFAPELTASHLRKAVRAIHEDAYPAKEFTLEASTAQELKAEAERKVLRENLLARAEKPLVGTLGDIGQTQMFGGGDLFAQPKKTTDTQNQDAPATSGSLEPDRPRGTAGDTGRTRGLQPAAPEAGGNAQPVGPERAESQDAGVGGGATAGGAAPAGGTAGAEPVQGQASRVPGRPARGEQPAGGGAIDEPRAAVESGAELDLSPVAPERPAVDTVAAEREVTARDRQLEQAKVQVEPKEWDRMKVADAESIAKSLPMLLPQQQDDVLKTERRFFEQTPTETDPKRGVMFTNGTGTGKTFTGLGIIKRFEMMGKGRVLIVVPSQQKVTDWKNEGARVMVKVNPLNDTNDVGEDVVATTYANLRDNWKLQSEPWDLVVYDESHYLSSNAQGNEGANIRAHELATNKPGWNQMEKWTQAVLGPRPSRREDEAAAKRYDNAAEQASKQIQYLADTAPDTKAVFLSATPFAYHKNLKYADGFLYSAPPRSDSSAYNTPQGFERYLVENFGYTMRTNRLNSPPPEVDTGLMEREWAERQFQQGSMSGRMIDVPYDYSREFVLLNSETGRLLDEGFRSLSGWDPDTRDRWPELTSAFNSYWRSSSSGYTKMMQFMESIKVADAIERMQQHLDMGRKIVLFHSYNNADPLHPFQLSYLAPAYRNDPAEQIGERQMLEQQTRDWMAAHPKLVQMNFRRLQNPRALVAQEFGDRVKFFNGEVGKKDRAAAITQFNDDNSGVDIFMVQTDAGKEGISLHDTTGKKQRVLMNASLPVKPTDAIQEEGRIYRIGVLSNAIQEYLVLHTNMERSAFGSKISQRTGTVENMALGQMARTLTDSFKSGYLNAHGEDPSREQGLGGKEQDKAELLGDDFTRAKSYYFGRMKKTSRNKAAEGQDYFATPEPLGLVMVRMLGAKPGMDLLEPSAGHGAIGRWFPDTTANKFIEPSRTLADELRIKVASGKVEVQPFEDLHIMNKFDGVAMNPPFGTAGKLAIEHLAKASRHLRQGGRMVAIIPEGPAMQKRFDAWLEGEGADMHLRASYGLPTVTFERAGTSVKTRLVVLDKADLWTVRHEPETGTYAAYDSFGEKRRSYKGGEKTLRDLAETNPEFIGWQDQANFQNRSPREIEAENVKEFFDEIENLEAPPRIVKTVATGALDSETTWTPPYPGAPNPSIAEAMQNMQQQNQRVPSMAPAAPVVTPAAAASNPYESAQTLHAKKGVMTYVAKMSRRLSDATYQSEKNRAKKFGGYYSAFKGSGAIPGFQFESADKRDAFVGGYTESAPLSSPRKQMPILKTIEKVQEWSQAENKKEVLDQLPEDLQAKIEADERWQWLEKHDASEEFAPWYPEPYRTASRVYADLSARQAADEELTAAEDKAMDKAHDKLLAWEMAGGPWNHVLATYEPEIEARMKEVIAQIEATGRWEWDKRERAFVATDEDNEQVLYSPRKQGGAKTEKEVFDHRLAVAKAEIEKDMSEGVVPRGVRSFAELHDSVDANEYVNDKERPDRMIGPMGKAQGWRAQEYVNFTNKLIEALDEWLKQGGAAGSQNTLKREQRTGIDEAAHEAATSPRNDLAEPTAAQKEAGNYAMGHAVIGGHEISIENPAGSRRRPEWPVLRDHYGYLKGTKGQDGDQVDLFVKPGTPADYAGPVHVVRQNVVEGGDDAGSLMLDAGSRTGAGAGKSARAPLRATGKLDEYKVMLGYPTAAEARAAYLRNYTPGWPGLAKLTTHTMPEFEVIKRSVFGGDAGARATDKALASAQKQGQGGGMANPDKADQSQAIQPALFARLKGSKTLYPVRDLDDVAKKASWMKVRYQSRPIVEIVTSDGIVRGVSDEQGVIREPNGTVIWNPFDDENTDLLAAPRKQGKALEMMAKADWGRIDKALTGRLAQAVTDAAQWIKKQALPGEAQVNPVDAALELLAGWSVEGQAAMGGVKLKPDQRQELMAQTRRQMRRAWNYAQRQLVPDASLPADVLAKKREMTMNQGLSNEVALDIGKRALAGKPKLSDLVVGEAQQNPEIRRKMFLAMNPRIDSGVTMDSLNPEERRVAEALLKLRDDLGKRMVKAGRIGLQTYEAMREGTSHYYDHDVKREKSLLRQMSLGLRNLFAQTATAYHIVDTQTKQPDGSPALVMHPGSRNRPTYRFETQEQMRGWYEEFIKDQILQAAEKGNAGRYPWMTQADKAALMGVTRDSLNNPGRMSAEQRAVVSRLQEQLRARFEKRMPLSYDEHSKAGLIEDPFYSVARQIAEMGHDVATAEFFNYIDSVPDYVRDAPTIGYTEMPDTAKLGALAGKYVRDDVAAEVQQLTELPGLGMKFYDALLGLFKTGKTVLNPGSHGRNIVGNIAFAHLAGSNPLNPGNATYYAEALRVLRDGGEAYREMYENGVLGGDFLTGEVKRSLRQLVPDADTVLREAENGNMTWLYGLKEHMARRWQGLLKTPGKALDIAATAWRLEDDIYKAAAYLKAKGMGMTSKEAAEHVREWFPYYDKGTSGTLKALGRFAFPFLSFKRESFRILKNGLTKKPLATIATLALPRLLTQIALTTAEMRLLMWTLGLGLKDERDKEDVMKALKGRAGRLLSPIAGDSSLFSILLPWRDDNGGLQQWDLSNTHPFGDWLATRIEDAESKEPWLARQAREMLTGSPLLGLLTETAFNKDGFTGRRIYEDDMSSGEATGKLVEHAFTELAPPITPTVSLPNGVKLEGTSARTIRKAFEQSPSKLAPARNPTQALIRTLVGLDVRPADPNLYEDVAKYREKNKLPAVPRGQQFPSDAVGRARAELYRLLIQPEVDVPAVKAQLEVLTKHGAKIPSVQDLFKDRQPQDVMRLKKHQARWMNQLPPEARRVLEAAQAQQSGAKPKALDAMAKARAGG